MAEPRNLLQNKRLLRLLLMIQCLCPVELPLCPSLLCLTLLASPPVSPLKVQHVVGGIPGDVVVTLLLWSGLKCAHGVLRLSLHAAVCPSAS